MMRHPATTKFLKNPAVKATQRAFTMVELLVSMGVVGLVIIPFMLTATTMLSKGVANSFSYAQSNAQVNDAMNDMASTLDGAVALVRPDSVAAWAPATYFEVSSYNANIGAMERVGYRLVNPSAGKWHLEKVIRNGTKTVSPYSTLKSVEVDLDNGLISPAFEYCSNVGGTEQCTNTNADLTNEFLSRLTAVRLDVDRFIVNGKGATTKTGTVNAGLRQFSLGQRSHHQTSGDMERATFLRHTSVAAAYGSENIALLGTSYHDGSGSSMALPNAANISITSSAAAPYDLATGVTPNRIAVDTYRNRYAFAGNNGTQRVWFKQGSQSTAATTGPATIQSSNFNNSTVNGSQYPILFDEFTGQLYWTSTNYVGSNPYGLTTPTTSPNMLYVNGFNPSRPELNTFFLMSTSQNISAREVFLAADKYNGALFLGVNNSGWNWFAYDTTNQRAVTPSSLTSASHTHVGSWDQSQRTGEFFFADRTTSGSRAALRKVNFTRMGNSLNVSTTTSDLGSAATPHQGVAHSEHLLVNDASGRAVINAATNFYTGDGQTALVQSPTTSVTNCNTDRDGTNALSRQPRQFREWFHNNYYYGLLSNGAVIQRCDAEASLWVNVEAQYAYWGGNGETVVRRSVFSSGSELALGDITPTGVSGTITGIAENRSIASTVDNSVLVYGVNTSLGKRVIVHNVVTNTQIANFDAGTLGDTEPWIMPIPHSRKIAFTFKDGADFKIKVYDAATGTYAANEPTVSPTFNADAKVRDVVAVNPFRQTMIYPDGSGNVELWSFGAGVEANMKTPNATLATGSPDASRYLRLLDLGNQFWEDAVMLAEDQHNAYILVNGSTRNGITQPDRMVRFKCHIGTHDASNNNAAPCTMEGEVKLTGAPNIRAYSDVISDGLDLAVNDAPGATEAYILNNGVVYQIANRNAWSSEAPTTLFSPGAQFHSLAKSSTTGNFYLLNASASSITNGLVINAYSSTGVALPTQNIVIRMDATSLNNASIAFAAGEFSKTDELRLELDEKRGLIHVVSDIIGFKNIYTFQKPGNHPL